MVKRDAGLCYVFLCAIDFEHDERSSFCETNPTVEQIQSAEEFRSSFCRSNLARNAEKSWPRVGTKRAVVSDVEIRKNRSLARLIVSERPN